MILTSFRCYMNAIVPTTEKDILLRAHYYIIDVSGDRYSNAIDWDNHGNMRINTPKNNNNFRIKYVSEIFNPEPHTSTINYIDKPGGACVANRQYDYLRHLMNPDTKYKIFNQLFDTENISEYPKMLIMFDEHNIITFGGIIAMFMSQTFGVDIEFIDESLRPNVFGNRTGFYPGNVQRGQQTIRECKNYKFKKDLRDMITETSQELTKGNITSQLVSYKTPELIYIYNMLFPDKPLYEGMYTRDDMLNIITGSICDEIEFQHGNGYEDLKESIGTYEQQLSDWERLEEDFRMEMLASAMNDTGG